MHEHSLTLRDNAMVCKAGDWPVDDDTPMPETKDMFSKARLEYSMDRITGHEKHLDQVVDTAVAALLGTSNSDDRERGEPTNGSVGTLAAGIEALCAEWDALSKGETMTTRSIRAVLARHTGDEGEGRG